jgi:CRISPR-associated protein (TIGR02584 family)
MIPQTEARLAAPAGRRILLVVTGLTPQVITETLYALLHEGRQALPHEIHILTTTEGAQRARLALLSEQQGWFHRLCVDFAVPSMLFGADQIHVLHDASGQPLADIRSADDNACAADQVAEWVRHFKQNAGTQLYVSLAGGRKILGFFAGYALSLCGRDGDRLTQVLVSEPFESSWDFFYPTPYERIIEARSGKFADCRQAEVSSTPAGFGARHHHLMPEPRSLKSESICGAIAKAPRKFKEESLPALRGK